MCHAKSSMSSMSSIHVIHVIHPCHPPVDIFATFGNSRRPPSTGHHSSTLVRFFLRIILTPNWADLDPPLGCDQTQTGGPTHTMGPHKPVSAERDGWGHPPPSPYGSTASILGRRPSSPLESHPGGSSQTDGRGSTLSGGAGHGVSKKQRRGSDASSEYPGDEVEGMRYVWVGTK